MVFINLQGAVTKLGRPRRPPQSAVEGESRVHSAGLPSIQRMII
jgi:hypothetical protein